MSNSVDPDETLIMRRLIWIYAVCKSLLFSSVAVNELNGKASSQIGRRNHLAELRPLKVHQFPLTANRADLDQTQRSLAFNLVLCCLPMKTSWDIMHKRVTSGKIYTVDSRYLELAYLE